MGPGSAPGGGACPGLSLKVLAASPGSGGSGGGTFALPLQEACGREASKLRRLITEVGLQPRVWAMPSLAASDAAVPRGCGAVAERWTLACFVRLVWKSGEGWKSSLGCIQPGFTGGANSSLHSGEESSCLRFHWDQNFHLLVALLCVPVVPFSARLISLSDDTEIGGKVTRFSVKPPGFAYQSDSLVKPLLKQLGTLELGCCLLPSTLTNTVFTAKQKSDIGCVLGDFLIFWRFLETSLSGHQVIRPLWLLCSCLRSITLFLFHHHKVCVCRQLSQ